MAAIRAVACGEIYIYPAMTRALLEDLIPSPKIPATPEPWEGLSEREQQALRLVAVGPTNQELADRLGLSVKNVGNLSGSWDGKARPSHPSSAGSLYDPERTAKRVTEEVG